MPAARHFFVAGKEPFHLAPRDPALYFVQRLRDEAHRFAIGTHRARRKKEFTKSPLDEIAGIGPARKRALLHAFGTAKAISRAALGDLEKVPGINAATAKLVYDFFHGEGQRLRLPARRANHLGGAQFMPAPISGEIAAIALLTFRLQKCSLRSWLFRSRAVSTSASIFPIF